MLKATPSTRPTPIIRQPSPAKTYGLGAQLAGPDYLRDTTRGGYRLGISDGVLHTISGFFTEEPGARDLSLRQRATVARVALELLSGTSPNLFQAGPDDGLHARNEKAKLSDSLKLFAEVERTGRLPDRGWGPNPARTFVAHALDAADR